MTPWKNKACRCRPGFSWWGSRPPPRRRSAGSRRVARRLPVTRLLVRGNPENLQQGVVLPDREEEMAWVASQLVAGHREGLPLHRLAVTSPVMDRYQRGFQGILKELLGPAVGEGGRSLQPFPGAAPRRDAPVHRGPPALDLSGPGGAPGRPGGPPPVPLLPGPEDPAGGPGFMGPAFPGEGRGPGLGTPEERGGPGGLGKTRPWKRSSARWITCGPAPPLPRPPAEPGPRGWRRRGSAWVSPENWKRGKKASSSASPLSWGTSPWPWGTRSSRPAGPWPGCTRALKTTSCRAPGCRRPGSRSWAGSRPGGWILTASFAWG